MPPPIVNQPAGPPTASPLAALLGWFDPRNGHVLRVLLLGVPGAIALRLTHAHPIAQFLAAMLALMPLAALMGEATEHLAHRAGPGIGGLLNATFGNAVELIVAMSLLFAGKDTVVKASLTGSILGNILLVLGASLLAGGLKYQTQRFNRTAAGVGATMMVLAAMGLLVPAIFHSLPELRALPAGRAINIEHELSLAVSVALMATYLLSLVFSLRTHKSLYNPRSQSLQHPDAPPPEPERPDAPPAWSIRHSLGVLLGATIVVGVLSEIIAGSIEEAGHMLGLTEVFLGVVVVAIVGNAAEHSSAILVALKNKMDLAVGIALGSALQVALFVAPVLVFASYLRRTPMDLLFTTLEIVAVILGVLIARMVAEDGESNWLEGVMLLMLYAVLAVAFFFQPEHAARGSTRPAAAPLVMDGTPRPPEAPVEPLK